MLREFRVFGALGIVAVVAVTALNACAASEQTMKDEGVYVDAAPPAGLTLSGNYLAGRFAQRRQDWDAAQEYMNEVVRRDDGNAMLEQRAFLLSVGAGEYDRARRLAEKIFARNDENTELSLIYLSCDAFTRNDFKTALDMAQRLPDDGFGQYTKPLLTAWALAGQGKKQEALEMLKAHADPSDPAYNLHAGMIEEISGDRAAALSHYQAAMASGELALHAVALIADVSKGEKRKLHAADGAGVALFDLAALLYERRAFDSAQIYASMVRMLMPQYPFSALLLGDVAAFHEQHAKAISFYDSVAKDSPVYWMSRLRVAEVHESLGRPDRAEALLTELAKSPENRQQALTALGDLYRREGRFDRALAAYDAALADVGQLTEEHWAIVYARGMSLERLNDWSRAEKDLLLALKFQPENPMILNFIGYSWVDKGVHLDRALELLSRAVALSPDDGYILDSYGWAFYRTGRYDEAVKWLERSVARVPDDPVILDHLGDAYWRDGRESEAKFKWKRARDISTDASFKSLVEGKIRRGMEPAPVATAHKEAKL